MIGIRTVRQMDVLSIMLLVGVCLSLSVASVLAANPAHIAVADRLLSRIRGSNPMIHQVEDHTCTYWNVYTQNVFNPPGTYTVVSSSIGDTPSCGSIGVGDGTPCINCSSGVYVYSLQQGGGGAVQSNNPQAQVCDVVPFIGECSGNLCISPQNYTGCTTTGPVYPSQ